MSHLFDLSIIYGDSNAVLNSLRSPNEKGKLITNSQNVMPEIENCDAPGCFRIGALKKTSTIVFIRSPLIQT